MQVPRTLFMLLETLNTDSRSSCVSILSKIFLTMSSMTRLNRLAILAAVCITPSLAHPLFSGKIIARAEDLKSQYDYVVVGAGASGLTVANRLSEQEGELSVVCQRGQIAN
jgi:hypothetical protein